MNFPRIDLNGKSAIVTGGSKGLGYAAAVALAKAGANIVLVSRNLQEVQAAAKTIMGVKAIGISCDVTSKASVEAMVAQSVAAMGSVDILVNNAGMNIRKLTVDVEESDWDQVINTNLKGVFLVGQAVGKQMIKQKKGGRIINMGGGAGVVGIPWLAAYCASKGGVVQLTKVWALEWAEHGITVNTIAPGYIYTPLTETWLSDKKRYDWIINKTPMGRLGTVEEIAGPILFLASDWAGYMTGSFLSADGDYVCV